MKNQDPRPATTSAPVATAGDNQETTPAEQAIHNNFVASARALRRSMARTLYYLLAVRESRIYRTFGFETIEGYAEHYGGLAPRTVAEMLTLARRMREVPALADAVQLGKLTWRKALLISREAMESNPGPLIKLAEDMSVRELKALKRRPFLPPPVRQKSPDPTPSGHGEAPSGPVGEPGDERAVIEAPGRITPPPCDSRANTESQQYDETRPPLGGERAARSVYVTLKMTPGQFAAWESLTAGRGGLVERVLAAMSRPGDGSPRHLVVLLHCPSCQATNLVTSRGDLAASPALLQRARCDGVVEDSSGTRRSAVSPRRRRAALRRARYRCEASGCANTRWLEIHHRVPVSGGGREDLENLVVLCSGCHQTLHEREKVLRDTVTCDP